MILASLSAYAAPSTPEYIVYTVPSGVSTYNNTGTLSYHDTDATLHNLFGIWADNVSYFTNSGTVRLLSEIDSPFTGSAPSVIVGAVTSGTQILNSGTIDIDLTINDVALDSSSDITFPYAGAYFINGPSLESIVNSGTIDSSSRFSNITSTGGGDNYIIGNIGIFADGATTGTLLNSGSIIVNNIVAGSDFDSLVTFNSAFGIAFDNSDLISVTNTGNIAVNTVFSGISAESIYVRGLGGIYGSADSISNSGNISLYFSDQGGNYVNNFHVANYPARYAFLYGIYSNLNSAQTITNSGNINVAVDTDQDAYLYDVYGIDSYNATTSSISNSGNINVDITLGDDEDLRAARGMISSFNTITNISAVKMADGGSMSLSNSGNINVAINANKNTGIRNVQAVLLADVSTAVLNNTGNISVDVKGGSEAAAMPVSKDAPSSYNMISAISLNNVGSAELTSTGDIFLSTETYGTDTYTLRMVDSTAVLKNAFSVALGSCSGCETTGTIYVDSSSSLNLNNAVLGATMNKYLKFNTPYTVISNDGAVTGSFSGLSQFSNPDFTLNWYGSETGENAKVTVSYNPSQSPAAMGTLSAISSAKTVGKIFNGSMLGGGIGGFGGFSYLSSEGMLLADSGEIATDAGLSYAPKKKTTSIFAFPFMTKMNGDGYDTNTFGVGVGLSHDFKSGISGSFYMGTMTTGIDYDEVSMDKTDSESFFAGLSAKTLNDLYISASLIAFLTDNDYSGYAGGNNDQIETADYDSKGFQTELLGGYSFHFAGSGKVTPFGGMSLSYYNMGNYSTTIADSAYSYLSKDYEAYSDWDTGLIAGVSAEYVKGVAAGKLKFFGEYRFEHTIGDNDITIGQSIPQMETGTMEIDQDVDNISHTLSLGTELSGSFWSTGVYGQYITNSDYDSYSLKLTAGLKF